MPCPGGFKPRRDDILDNITLYWLTNTAVSSGRLHWDTRQMPGKGGFFDVRGVALPVAVTVFSLAITIDKLL